MLKITGKFSRMEKLLDAKKLFLQRGFRILSENDFMPNETGSKLQSGITSGGIVGGLFGLAAGTGSIAAPEILSAAGPITGLIVGSILGSAAGGLIDHGYDAIHAFAQKQKAFFLTVQSPSEEKHKIIELFHQAGADEVDTDS